jgi:hypothetical protein
MASLSLREKERERQTERDKERENVTNDSLVAGPRAHMIDCGLEPPTDLCEYCMEESWQSFIDWCVMQ